MKLLSLMLSCALLVGCSGAPAPSPEPTDAAAPVVEFQTEALSTAILTSGGFSQVIDSLPLSLASGYYGLDFEPVDGAIYCSMEGGYEGFCVLYFETSDHAAQGLIRVGDYLNGQLALEQSMKYKPQDIPKLSDPYLYQNGTLVVMAVADDLSTVKDSIRDYIA